MRMLARRFYFACSFWRGEKSSENVQRKTFKNFISSSQHLSYREYFVQFLFLSKCFPVKKGESIFYFGKEVWGNLVTYSNINKKRHQKYPFMETNCHLNNTTSNSRKIRNSSCHFRQRPCEVKAFFCKYPSFHLLRIHPLVKYGWLFSIILRLIFDNMRKIYLKEFSAWILKSSARCEINWLVY